MQHLAGDAELRLRLGEAGRARVERHFTLDQMLGAHLSLCEELAGA